MRFGSVILLGSLTFACSTDEPEPSVVRPSAAPVQEPEKPPTPGTDVSFPAGDTELKGRLHLTEDASLPLLVLVHRFRGDRLEWAPLVDRVTRTDKRYSIVWFDLRGHGASPPGERVDPGNWSDTKSDAVEAFVEDVRAAVKFGLERTGGRARGVVLAGTSLGAALAASVAATEPKVMAVALVSPGAAIQGFDVYEPFARVRTLPSFLAGAAGDNVSREPMSALSRMAAGAATIEEYPGSAHSVIGLVEAGAPLVDDLERWLQAVHEEPPHGRKDHEGNTPLNQTRR